MNHFDLFTSSLFIRLIACISRLLKYFSTLPVIPFRCALIILANSVLPAACSDDLSQRPTFCVSWSVSVRTKRVRHSLPLTLSLFLLTHLGSNQDSAEPKSDVLPITPWVNITNSGAAKLGKILFVMKRIGFCPQQTAQASNEPAISESSGCLSMFIVSIT